MTFDLYKLGWRSFQGLCLTIVRESLGQTVQSFLDSKDGGRDGAFVGTWTPRAGEAISGHFVIQCKFTSKPGYVMRLSDVGDEISKAERLVQRGQCDAYILLTNAGVSGRFDEEFRSVLRAAGVETPLAYGERWICEQIQESRRLRMLVPRVYGLGDLSEILDERAYAQAHALLAAIREDLARVVMTRSYEKAALALEKHRFVLLVGEPAAGKTTIASMLGMAAIDRWGASVLKLDQAAFVVKHWNPQGEAAQFFWIDDAFGVTQYEPTLVHAWNHSFAQVRAMLRGGARVVMTSRDYIYKRARQDLKTSSFPLLTESQVVIDVHDLTLDEKKQILYNHLKLGTQTRSFRSAVKPHMDSLAAHPRFVPETARRLSDPTFTKSLRPNLGGILEFAEKQREFLLEVLTGLDPENKAALALIFMRNGMVESPIALSSIEVKALERLGSTLGASTAALAAMDGSLAKYVTTGDVATWQFKHPTIGDAFAELLLCNPELLGIYLHGASFDKLLDQVTCGDLGFENAVRVTRPLFPSILGRLREADTARRDTMGWSGKSRLDFFLARRCSKDFLEFYIAHCPELLERILNPGVYVAASTGVNVVLRLFEFGLLTKEQRRSFLDTVTTYAFEDGDPEALTNDAIRKMFSDEEWRALILRVRSDLAIFLARVREGYEESYSSKQDPQDLIDPFLALCKLLTSEFRDDPKALRVVEDERKGSERWLEETLSEREESELNSELGRSVPDPSIEIHRSIFDDVDA